MQEQKFDIKQKDAPRRKRGWLFRIFRVAGIVYLILCMLTYCFQNWLLFPAHSAQGTEDARIHPTTDVEILHLTTRTGVPIAAIFAKALLPNGKPDPHPERRPTILYFYRNGGAIAWSWNELALFRQLDTNVMIPDFAGFGASGGSPGEKPLYDTADAAYESLLQRNDIDKSKIITFGWSLGGAVAIDLASRRPMAGLATFNAFTTIREMAHRRLPWLPTRWLVSYTFDNLTKIAQVRCPTLICNGKRDTLVPPSMSDRLAAAAGGPVTRLVLPRSDHNTVFTANLALLRPVMQTFVDAIAATTPGAENSNSR